MAAPPLEALESKTETAAALYHRLVFVVGASSDDRTSALEALARARSWPVVNFGVAFSELLLDVPRRYRATRAPEILADLIASISKDVVLVDHIEILFTPELSQDAVRLLQGLSRNRTLVVSWPGIRDGCVLSYATADHPEYCRQSITDLMHVDLAGEEQSAHSG